MTTTYSGDPSSSSKDAVRFLCQDTDMEVGVVRLQDEEILWMITQQNNLFMCAADAAEAIAGYWSKRQDQYIGPLRLINGQQFDRYTKLADRLRAQANRKAGAQPVFFPANSDAYTATGPYHLFWIGMNDMPGANASQFLWPPFDLPPLSTYP